MEGEEAKEQNKSRVIKVDSKETWDFSLSSQQSRFPSRCTLHGIVVHAFRGDIDDVKDVASSLEIKAMPTFLIIKDGAPIDKLVGANPEEIKKRINSFAQLPTA